MYMLRDIMAGNYTFSSPIWNDVSDTPKDLVRFSSSSSSRDSPCFVFSFVFFISNPRIEGRNPFHSFNPHRQKRLVRFAKFSFENSLWKEVSDEAKDLVRRFLCAFVSPP